jgi:prolyl oligopeptidase
MNHFLTKAQEDPYLWLEEVEGTKPLEFVQKLNQTTFEKIGKTKEYESIYNKSLEIFNSTDKIAYPTIHGNYVYNFWKDKDHIRGIWRRTTRQNYHSEKINWEVLLDLDELSKKENQNWVFKGASTTFPAGNLFLVSLSKGGGDATVIREFDVSRKSFVEKGFKLEEGKGDAVYLDENTLIVSRSDQENMTTSGYPTHVKFWKRETPVENAGLMFEGKKTDVGTWGSLLRSGTTIYPFIIQASSFFTSKKYVWFENKLIQLEIPEDAEISELLNNQLVLNLKSEWQVNGKVYRQGSVVSVDFKKMIDGIIDIYPIFTPNTYSSVEEVSAMKNKLLVNVLTNVKNELFVYSFEKGKWISEKVSAPDYGKISIGSTDKNSEQYYFLYQNSLTPPTLYHADAQTKKIQTIKSLPAFFDGSKYKIEQYKAKSKDGTEIPYFVVSGKITQWNGTNPTLLYAYGGFEASSSPYYLNATGCAWLENGGVYVLANIRGGGEFGPAWHQAGLKEKRQTVYNDFHAVAEDLIAKKITSNKHLGIMGGSNGGLLVGVAFTQRPDLYQAVVCQVPLLDMQRYNKLLAGASWMDEYGNPDIPEEWEYIKKYSPYHNLKPGVAYPEVLFLTSTKDDRVHPGHARKMAAKMIDMGYPVLYYENTEGGHAGASTNEQTAKLVALEFSYLLMKLK